MAMVRYPFFIVVFFLLKVLMAQNNEIQLLVRADDIGSFHAANVGFIESYQNGIARSVELMPTCTWFPGAVEMLNENPGYDVGIHLLITSEKVKQTIQQKGIKLISYKDLK